jgi:hypothetical protein
MVIAVETTNYFIVHDLFNSDVQREPHRNENTATVILQYRPQ